MQRAVFRLYVRGLFILGGGLLLLVAGVNALVNPFNLYEEPRFAGINDYKYMLIKHQRLSKAAEVLRLRPDCLVLGTSRMQVALDPAYPGWGACHAYNLALNNAGIYESLRYFQHAVALRKPKDVILELEQNYGQQTQGGFSEERFVVKPDGSPNPGWWRAYAYDVFTGIVSWEALHASWRTVFPVYQKKPGGPEDGFWEYTPVDGKMLRHGQHALFRALMLEAFGQNRSPRALGPVSFRGAAALTNDGDTFAGGYEYLRAILALAHREGVRLHLVIPPSHAWLWDGLLEAGSWPGFEMQKRMWVSVNEDEARRAGRAPFPLWDFSGFNAYTTEPVPPADDRETRMRWYWEAQHFTRQLGDRMLDRMLADGAKNPRRADDFGVRLDSRNIEARLAAIRAAGDRWRREYPQDVAEIAALVHGGAHGRAP